jgi:ribosomal protein S12 methylthiotransferase accessory factor
VACFDLTPSASWPGVVAGVLLRDPRGGANALTAGYACRDTWAKAEQSALFEAAQSRLTDVHGARDDVHHRGASADDAEPLFRVRTGGIPRAMSVPKFEWAMVDLPSPGPGVHVVRVLSPQCRVSSLF